MTNTITVCCYPKAGGTWIARLLGDLLDWPIKGVNETIPMGKEGPDRQGGGVVFSTHAEAVWEDGDKLFPNQMFCDISAQKDEGLVHVVRDPRGIAVSSMFYWEVRRNEELCLRRTMNSMADPEWPITLAWPHYVREWAKVECPVVHYKDLHADAAGELEKVLGYYNIEYDESRMAEVVARQEFSTKRKAIETEPEENYAYNRGIQMSHLRKGQLNDWMNHFTPELESLAQELFGEEALLYGYEL